MSEGFKNSFDKSIAQDSGLVARASVVNRTHRVVRERAKTMAAGMPLAASDWAKPPSAVSLRKPEGMKSAAMASLPVCPESKRYYQRKRAEGKRHEQALLCLARRRLNVLWAMLRDNTDYHCSPPLPVAA